ncbi:GNAT family N-acetyltransferase [Pigmentiphaga sp. NML080357]|uniref:GNAT family N-acetyltransferase n=1 Tax=Pigmentiphaga sp. NML080357 TaxID=2008675 RepID=UPI000B40B4BF|nr:GNAT family N-acetyltransferase [Pigmentiphaga sp. NML080357]OVZ63710.1 GNAT family N-acetyltransferase [Pigmentiphaga sp. NML080357]
MTTPDIRLAVGPWSDLRHDASSIRQAVFVDEQSVPLELEYDDADAVCLHAVAYDAAGSPLGTGRLLPDGHIGRMAVHRHARGLGVGGAILDALIAEAQRRGHRRLLLHAQTRARRFYETRGFQAEGEEFMEAGIPHVLMALALPAGARDDSPAGPA